MARWTRTPTRQRAEAAATAGIEPTRWFLGTILGSLIGAGCVLSTTVLDAQTDPLAYIGAWLPAVGLLTGLVADRTATRASNPPH